MLIFEQYKDFFQRKFTLKVKMIYSKIEHVDIWGVQGFAGRGRLLEKASLQQGAAFQYQARAAFTITFHSVPPLSVSKHIVYSFQSKLTFICMLIVLFTTHGKDFKGTFEHHVLNRVSGKKKLCNMYDVYLLSWVWVWPIGKSACRTIFSIYWWWNLYHIYYDEIYKSYFNAMSIPQRKQFCPFIQVQKRANFPDFKNVSSRSFSGSVKQRGR